MREPIIVFDGVYYRYEEGGPYALRNVSFSVEQGEWLAIVGHNGSGKSTIAKLMNGILFPEKGSVKIKGYLLSEETIWTIRDIVGMVFQNPDNQFVGTTVQDDVAFGLENHGISRDEMIRRVHDSLQKVKMDSYLNHEPHALSGGQKQRVAIASVLALRPEVIILDEATSMLDPRGRFEVMETIRELKNEKNLTIISITHDLEEAQRADRIIVMNAGEVYAAGKPREIFSLDEQLISLGLDIPFAKKLVKGLRKRGLPIAEDLFEEEELVDCLWKLWQKI
jgi:ABC transporter./Cobalt ATP-binding cassette C terminal.